MKIKAVQYVKPYARLEKDLDGTLIVKTGTEFTRYELMYEENGDWITVPVEFVTEEDGIGD